MKFTNAIVGAILSATALAAPAPAPAPEVKSMMAGGEPWVIEGMVRNCSADDTSCTWSFAIDTHTSTPTACSFTVLGSPASQTDVSGIACGPYTVGAGWSGQFGPGNGFTTLSVVDYATRLIVWPAYTDAQLVSGVTVVPDQSYTPTVLA